MPKPNSKHDPLQLSPAAHEAFELAKEKALKGDEYELRAFASLREYPVSVEEFITGVDYLGSQALYPAVMEAIIELNNPVEPNCQHRARLWTHFSEAILTGAIGVGKSTIAVYSMAYQLYVLSCFRSPHTLFELDASSEIVFVFQNKTERLAKAVDYDRFKALIDNSPYFRSQFSYDPSIKSELRFPHRIVVKPLSGSDTAAIGQNVFSGVIDEVNQMETVDVSRRNPDGRAYDQASNLYESIARRRSSRFLKRGRLPGLLCLVSSRRYPGQFTDTKEQERRRQLEKTGQTSIYLYDKRLWDVKPVGTYAGPTFRVFSGDLSRKPFIMGKKTSVSAADQGLIIDVPEEHRPEFERDILNALRDIAGLSTTAIHPFLTNRDAVAKCFVNRPSVLSADETDLPEGGVQIYPQKFLKPHLIRFAHLDLSMTGDATGIVLGCVNRFVEVPRGDEVEVLPHVHIDAILRVVPPPDGEIPFHRIRELLYRLKEEGLNLEFISADSFQSVDMLQTLRRKGFTAGVRSMDRTPDAYEILKSALYDQRVSIPRNRLLQSELLSLEMDAKTGKIDHPPAGSKDLADALAGVVYGLTMRREVWFQHRVDPYRDAPSLTAAVSGLSSRQHIPRHAFDAYKF